MDSWITISHPLIGTFSLTDSQEKFAVVRRGREASAEEETKLSVDSPYISSYQLRIVNGSTSISVVNMRFANVFLTRFPCKKLLFPPPREASSIFESFHCFKVDVVIYFSANWKSSARPPQFVSAMLEPQIFWLSATHVIRLLCIWRKDRNMKSVSVLMVWPVRSAVSLFGTEKIWFKISDLRLFSFGIQV
jgi:hypothetical protein